MARGRVRARLPFVLHPVSRRYGAGLLIDVVRQSAIVLAIVESIFLGELVLSELLPRTLDMHAGFANLALLVVFAAPEGIFLSLPLSVLVAAYLIFLRRREAGEFAVIVGMGHPVQVLVGAALLLGISGFAVSQLLAGYVEPNASYQLERAFFHITSKSLRDGEFAPGKFYDAGDQMVFVSHGRLADGANNIFIQQSLPPDRTRMIVARSGSGLDGISGSQIGLMLQDVTVLDFNLEPSGPPSAAGATGTGCADCRGPSVIKPIDVLLLNRIPIALPQLPLSQMRAQDAVLDNLSTTDLLARGPPSNLVAAILGKRLLRGLLCLLAPILGLLAVALTRPATLLFALPAASALILAGSFFGPTVVVWLARFGFAAAVGIPGLLAISLIAISAVLVGRWEGRCIAPTRVRL